MDQNVSKRHSIIDTERESRMKHSNQTNDEPNRSNFIASGRTIIPWQPKWWKRFCSNAACPSYADFISFVGIVLIFFLIWSVLLSVAPHLANPQSQFFNMLTLIILSHIIGTLFNKLTTLPALIGMLFMGVLMQNIGYVDLDGQISNVTGEIRKIAVVIILTMAGLSLDYSTLKRLFGGIMKIGLIPWIVECIVIALLTHYIFHLPWSWAFLLGSIVASVSPAVVVPCFIQLINEGYGVEKGIPTLILAASSIDDTISLTIYGIISSIVFVESSFINNILQGPVSLVGGVGFGVLWGCFLKYVPEKSNTYVSTLRILLLFLGCYGISSVSNTLGFSGAGALATITASFIAGHHWSQDGWHSKDNPVVTAYELSWYFFEPALFGLTGASLKFDELDSQVVAVGTACLLGTTVLRIVVTVLICHGDDFNMKEKIFIGLSWFAKATVQAALGPVALDYIIDTNGSAEEIQYAKIILTICILSIVLTAPLGAILISIAGPKLLSKTVTPIVTVEHHVDENNHHNGERINQGCTTFL